MQQAELQARLTAEKVRQIVGTVDDVTVARIIDTGANTAELLEAYQWLVADEAFSDAPRSLSGSVRQIYEILETELTAPPEER
jgi:cyanophycinase-like exopeptidase